MLLTGFETQLIQSLASHFCYCYHISHIWTHLLCNIIYGIYYRI